MVMRGLFCLTKWHIIMDIIDQFSSPVGTFHVSLSLECNNWLGLSVDLFSSCLIELWECFRGCLTSPLLGFTLRWLVWLLQLVPTWISQFSCQSPFKMGQEYRSIDWCLFQMTHISLCCRRTFKQTMLITKWNVNLGLHYCRRIAYCWPSKHFLKV